LRQFTPLLPWFRPRPRRSTLPLFGANMAFRKEMFDKYGLFRADLGPSACVEVPPSEDTEFGGRLVAAGEYLRYEPSAIVYHPVAGGRINKRYFLKWFFDLGAVPISGYSESVPGPNGSSMVSYCICFKDLQPGRRAGCSPSSRPGGSRARSQSGKEPERSLNADAKCAPLRHGLSAMPTQ
jgi:hypothetical protein